MIPTPSDPLVEALGYLGNSKQQVIFATTFICPPEVDDETKTFLELLPCH